MSCVYHHAPASFGSVAVAVVCVCVWKMGCSLARKQGSEHFKTDVTDEQGLGL